MEPGEAVDRGRPRHDGGELLRVGLGDAVHVQTTHAGGDVPGALNAFSMGIR